MLSKRVAALIPRTTARMATVVVDNKRPAPDKELQDIADYVHDYKINTDVAWETGRLCFLDTLGCGLEALKYKEPKRIIGPVVEGTKLPYGAHVPGTDLVHDPIRGAFAIGVIIRWLDFNDAWLAAEWGHPSDNLGAILSVADYETRRYRATNGKEGKVFKVRDVIEGMIKAHEIQGGIATENALNSVGLDHVALVKVASAAVVSKMMGLSREQTVAVVSQAFCDGQSLRTYRHVPNTMSRKSWAAGDACMRAVNLAWLVKQGEGTMPSILSAKTWGFYDAIMKGKAFKFQRPYGSYVMENILFKISYPAEFHSQTAVEAAMTIHKQLKDQGKSSDDIKSVRIRTQDAGYRIINKSGELNNFADRDHCIQYMIAVPLIFGRLTAADYHDDVAKDPRIDALRDKMTCEEDKQFSKDYLDPEKRYIGNALLVTLNDGTVLDEVVVDYPIGHRLRREEGTPKLLEKFERHIRGRLPARQADEILKLSDKKVGELDIDKYMDLYTTDFKA